MSAAKFIRGSNVTPVSTPPGPQPSDNAFRTILAKRAARIDELEIENAELQTRLEDALSRVEADIGDQPHPDTTVATKTKAEDDYAILKRQYQNLEARHKKLQAEYDKREEYVNAATKKYRKAKESAMQWQAYISKHLNNQAGEHAHQTPRGANTFLPVPPPPIPQEVSDIDVTPKALRQASTEAAEIANELPETDHPVTGAFKRAEPSGAINENPRSSPSSLHSKRITSSQTTEDDQAEVRSYAVKAESRSDDEPLVVRENALKRRSNEPSTAMPPPQRIKQEPESPKRPGSAEEPIELRSEEWSSPTTRAQPLIRAETSDLDAMRGTFQTPRKRKPRDVSRAKSEERSNATLHPPRHLARSSSSLSYSDIPDLPALPVALEQAEALASTRQAATPNKHTTPKERSHGRQRGALGQLSPNVPTNPQTAKKRRRTSEEDAGKVGILAEDGDENTSQVTPKADDTQAKTPASNRLESMLENPTPGRQPLSARRLAPDTSKRIRLQRLQHNIEPTSHIKTAASSSSKGIEQLDQLKNHTEAASPPTSKYRRPPGIEKSPPPINPDHEPLRSRPLNQLRPHNFRINPAFADSDFAFSDPMNRKTKAARRCLPGCINPACCGEFLDAARHGLLPPSSKSDAHVLEDMFGSSYAEIMASYPPHKHAELLIQARAQEFANEHGKHRNTFERAATPPGFWRTEMPSTQEELEDRRKAEEMERMKTEGMWREAMRGGGRWLFRDE
ncbi:hypothetical protein MBLNU13_g11088t1 [Cladosporium sp. NU13]